VKRGWRVASYAGMALVVAALGLGGCSNLRYYWDSASGHMTMMAAARPVPDWLADEAAPQPLKQRLELSLRIRRFASDTLMLPDNLSYTRYADLRRPAAVWNVVAAPELSLTLHRWCFPVAGCVGYRGYFDEPAAQAQARQMREQGLEATVYPVPAYSTLGWMNWAGGDPLLNTFIHYPEGELARLIFHELAHQVLYVKDDTPFNESFATAVERLGGAIYLDTQAGDAARREYAQYDERRRAFRALVRNTRERLAAIYGKGQAQPPDVELARRQKVEAMREFRAGYAQLRERWGLEPTRLRVTDRWVAEANNASFGAMAAYDELVPGFEALFAREGRDWRRFYEAVRRLAQEPADVRREQLKTLGEGQPPGG
jgi:predicted aminopeptidase